MNNFKPFSLLLFLVILSFCDCSNDSVNNANSNHLQLSHANIGPYGLDINNQVNNTAAPLDKPLVFTFSSPLNTNSVQSAVTLRETTNGVVVPLTFSYLDNDQTFSASHTESLKTLTNYTLEISPKLTGKTNEEFPGYSINFSTVPGELAITSLKIEGNNAMNSLLLTGIPLLNPIIEISFSTDIDPASVNGESIKILGSNGPVPLTIEQPSPNTLLVKPSGKLADLSRFNLVVNSNLKGINHEVFTAYNRFFYTIDDSQPKFPVISDDELLTKVQQQTFKYFWDFAHPSSGMARERNSSGDVVTTGGSGFGIMAIIVGIERGFITRDEGVQRLDKILTFLEGADRFHGAWSHWINGNTGKVYPFSTNDNGGDLVETSFLMEGLLTFRQYLHSENPTENTLISRINTLWEGVEWDWYTQGGQDVLYWHWSPDEGWIMNHQIRGWNETLITYVLAASSPTHPIAASVYHNGFANNGAIKNGKSFYNITLPLGEDYGGPLFFTHYSFLGLDPRNLSDQYANYWTQNVNHTLINRAYAIANPKHYVGYGENDWGLTASDNQSGYSAHSPTNDLGVITPTAALSAFPYTPEYSMAALKFFYYKLGDRLWGEYGFHDAFNLNEGWFADSYLAIDQGPIIVMIENYRTGLLWNLFMSAPEVQSGLDKLSFSY
jgi:hypothetical protein